MVALPRQFLLAASLVCAGACGCACSQPQAPEVWSGPMPPCFGYHPTCWNPWPSECGPCPVFPLPAGNVELPPVEPLPVMPPGALHQPAPRDESFANVPIYPGIAASAQSSTVISEPEMAPVVTPDMMWRVNSVDPIAR